MAQLGETFDHTQVEPRDNFDPLPPAWYTAEVTESDVLDTKSGNGRRLPLTFEIKEGPFEGRRVWASINFQNANDIAQRIGQQELAELCSAVGLRGPLDDTNDLHGIPVRIKVGFDKNDPTRNVVKGYKPMDDSSAQVAQAPRTPAPTQRQTTTQPAQKQTAAGGGAARPWQR